MVEKINAWFADLSESLWVRRAAKRRGPAIMSTCWSDLGRDKLMLGRDRSGNAKRESHEVIEKAPLLWDSSMSPVSGSSASGMSSFTFLLDLFS